MNINNGFGSAQWLCLITLSPSSNYNLSHFCQTRHAYVQMHAALVAYVHVFTDMSLFQ